MINIPNYTHMCHSLIVLRVLWVPKSTIDAIASKPIRSNAEINTVRTTPISHLNLLTLFFFYLAQWLSVWWHLALSRNSFVVKMMLKPRKCLISTVRETSTELIIPCYKEQKYFTPKMVQCLGKPSVGLFKNLFNKHFLNSYHLPGIFVWINQGQKYPVNLGFAQWWIR